MVLVTWKSNELRIPDFVRAEEQEESVVAAEGLWFYLRVLRAFESIKSWDVQLQPFRTTFETGSSHEHSWQTSGTSRIRTIISVYQQAN